MVAPCPTCMLDFDIFRRNSRVKFAAPQAPHIGIPSTVTGRLRGAEDTNIRIVKNWTGNKGYRRVGSASHRPSRLLNSERVIMFALLVAPRSPGMALFYVLDRNPFIRLSASLATNSRRVPLGLLLLFRVAPRDVIALEVAEAPLLLEEFFDLLFSCRPPSEAAGQVIPGGPDPPGRCSP